MSVSTWALIVMLAGGCVGRLAASSP